MTEQGLRGGLVLHAVVRNRRSERALDALQGRGPGSSYRLVEADQLAAAVTASAGEERDEERLVIEHARIVDQLLRRSSVVPVPLGLVARDDDAVRAFLEAQRVPLLEALDFLDDSYEVRLHIRAMPGSDDRDRLLEAARHVYQELRRPVRAARILGQGDEERILSAAFLILRGEWIRFVEQIEDWGDRYAGLRMDVTGPWAPYDFVQLMPGDSQSPLEVGAP